MNRQCQLLLAVLLFGIYVHALGQTDTVRCSVLMSQGNRPMNALHQYLGYPGSFYGFGSIVFKRGGIQYVGNAGESVNQNALLVMAPDCKTTFIALSNTGYHPFIRTIEKAVGLYLPATESKSVTLPPEHREELLGKYYMPKLNKARYDTLEILPGESGLLMRMPDGKTYPLNRRGDRLYEYRDPGFTFPLEITFYQNSKGQVMYLNDFARTRVKVQ